VTINPQTLFDLKAEILRQDYLPSTVLSARVSTLGDVTISLESGLRLDVFVASTAEDDESWRVLGFADESCNFVFPEDAT
jgi:hypothetical protein